MQPTGWIGAILAPRSSINGIPIYRRRTFQPPAERQAVGRHSALPDFKPVVAVSSQREHTCSSRVASVHSGALACCISPVGVLAFLAIPGYTASMKFAWDEQKNQSNIRKHGFSFADAWEIFAAPMLIDLDDRFDYGEDRWIGIG
jgi:hypothetical protein